MIGGIAAALLLAAGPLPGDEPAFQSLTGSGLLTLPDARTLPRGRFFAGTAVDNRDRDPLGIDVLDAGLTLRAGVTPRLELHGQAVLSRVVSLPVAPAVAPPLDLVIAPGADVPARPYYSILWSAPYVDKTGTARLDAWVHGDLTLGGTYRIVDARRARPAVALSAAVAWPLDRSAAALRSGAGTGAVDARLRVSARWSVRRFDLVGSAAFVRRGRPVRSDRLVVTIADGPPAVRDERLEAPDRVEWGGGLRRLLGRRVAAVGEVNGAWSVGARTPVLDDRHTIDGLGGLQCAAGPVRLTAALRYHLAALPSGASRATPLAGAVDVTAVTAAALDDYVGVPGTSAALRPEARHLIVGARRPPPAGAHVIPATYSVRSEHQIGFALVIGLVF